MNEFTTFTQALKDFNLKDRYTHNMEEHDAIRERITSLDFQEEDADSEIGRLDYAISEQGFDGEWDPTLKLRLKLVEIQAARHALIDRMQKLREKFTERERKLEADATQWYEEDEENGY